MSYKKICYYSCNLLPCASCGDEVVLCMHNVLVADGAPFIEAVIAENVTKVLRGGKTQYKYNIQYDTDLLVQSVGDSGLNECDIKSIICKGCTTSFIEWKADQGRILAVQEAGEVSSAALAELAGRSNSIMIYGSTLYNATQAFASSDGYKVNAKDQELSLIKSVAYNFTNPDEVRSLNVIIKGVASVEAFNTDAARTQALVQRLQWIINDIATGDGARVESTLIPAGNGSGSYKTMNTDYYLVLAPGATVKIQAEVVVLRTGGADPTDTDKLVLDKRGVSLQQILAVYQ